MKSQGDPGSPWVALGASEVGRGTRADHLRNRRAAPGVVPSILNNMDCHQYDHDTRESWLDNPYIRMYVYIYICIYIYDYICISILFNIHGTILSPLIGYRRLPE